MANSNNCNQANGHSRADALHQVTTFTLLMVVACVALGIASTFSFVGGRMITQSQLALRQMRIHEQELQRLKQLVETLPGGVAFVDARTSVITYANEGFRNITGRSSSELLGKSIMTVMPEDERDIHRQRVLENHEETWQKYKTETLHLPSATIPRSDGTESKWQVRIRGTEVNGKREWLVFIDPRVTGTPNLEN